MGKFLFGLITGAVLVVLILVIGFFAIASLKSKPPAVADNSTLILHLDGDVPEKPPLEFPIPFLERRVPMTVQGVWSLLRRAAADPKIKAVVFEPQDLSIGWAKMQEIRADLEQFRKSGKPLYAYVKTPGAREYYIATACSKVFMPPVDLLNLKGIAFEIMYFKNTLDKLGVHVDVEHAGKYKDFGDMFTRTSMSPETREVMNSIVDDMYGDLVNTIARGRGKDPNQIRAIIDNGPFLSSQAKQNGLVDDLRYEDEVFGQLRAELHETELKKVLEKEYANAADSPAKSGSDRIAFVVAEGTITRGDPETSSEENGLESEYFDRMLNRVANDSSIKAVIVRIDSPGGEVTASDDMWRAMNDLKRKKPVVISMSDDAASGGYYMAMAGAPIVAYPGTFTGSIGVVFGKPDLHGLYDKVGVTKDSVSRGRFALIDSDYQSLSDAGKQKLREGIDSDYEQFVGRVAASRHRTVDQIQAVAQGRVWLGDQAKANGLVDALGGLDRAIEMAKQSAGIPATKRAQLVLYPPKRSVWDMLMHSSSADAQTEAVLSRAGLEPLRAAWKDARLRVWMKGGMLRMMPFAISFK
jgi:protease IV